MISKSSVVKANGLKFDRDTFKKFGAFVDQDDIMWESSTPYELFTFAARLRTRLDAKGRQ